MSDVGFRINAQISRAEPSLVARFKGLPVANVADCMNRIACVDPAVRPFNKSPLVGTALTVRAADGDNLMFYKAFDLARPGDVLVVAGGGTMTRAYCGEIMVRFGMKKGLAGFIVDGCIRDADTIAGIDFPVYAKHVSPNGPFKNGPGEIGYPVSFAGQVIHPGDIILGDGDGLLAIRPHEAESVLREAIAVGEKETKIMADIEAGTFDISWIDAVLHSKGCVLPAQDRE